MKLAAGWFREQRGLALGILIGALTLGKAIPHLLTALFGDVWGAITLVSSSLAVFGGVVVLAFVRDGPYVTATTPFDPRAVWRILQSRGTRLATFGYLGHMWELYAMWTWIAVLAAASFAAAGMSGATAAGSLAAFLAIGSGTAGCAVAGWLADRLGRARVAIWAMWTSAACAGLTPLAFGGSPVWFSLLVMIWGFAVVADSAQFSALVSEHAPQAHVGTALTLQTCLGFLLTMVTIDLMPRVADVVGWRFAALLLVPGPLLGIIAMRGLTAGGGSSDGIRPVLHPRRLRCSFSNMARYFQSSRLAGGAHHRPRCSPLLPPRAVEANGCAQAGLKTRTTGRKPAAVATADAKAG